MSTTDTRAAFEAHYRKECGMPDSAAFQWDAPYMVAALDGWQAALAWQAATEATKAEQSTPIAPTLAQQIEESNYKRAFMEWSQKTDWVQEQISTFPANAIGKHRADVMREEIERLRAEAAKATGTAGEQTKQSFENIEELPPLPECAYVQHGPFANRDLFTVAQMREYGQACAEAARLDADAAKRLRLICKLLGIESHVPADDETLWGAAFAVLGQVRAALEAARQPAPVMLSDKEIDSIFDAQLEKYGQVCDAEDFRIFARAILAATNRSQP